MNEDHRNVIDANAQEMHTSLGELNSIGDSLISSFYAGKSIFITGASGFMGKVLVEKLLRSCPDVKSIYILLRTKKNVDPCDRLDELIRSKIFDRVREMNANLLNKVVVIPGDIVLPGLGISNANIELLSQEVSIVFHSAATVKFDEPMRTSINFNALGTRHMLELCRKMKKLEAFVHVSTAYSNCDRHDVGEQFYPITVPYQKIIELNEWMDDETLAAVTPQLLGNRPNTYTYTKALAETLLLNEKGSLPVAIVRPSIVTAAWREPYPGWVDNINGPTGMVLASGKGLLRTMLYDSKACADIIPVDMVINLMIAVAWYTAVRRPKNIQIYNCTSGTLNTLKWKDIERIVFPLLLKYPSANVFRYPGGTFKESRTYNRICGVFGHIIPAYLFDGIRLLCLQKPMLIRIYQKLHRAIEALEYFTTRGWDFSSTNVIALSQELQGIDQKEFHFDVRNLNWLSYWEDYVIGIRKFILKEEDSMLPKARKNLKRIYYAQKFLYLFIAMIIPFILATSTTFISLEWLSSIITIIWPFEFIVQQQQQHNLNFQSSPIIEESSSMNITPIISLTTIPSSQSRQSSIWTLLASYIGLPISSITT